MKIFKSIFCVLLIFFSLNDFCFAQNSSSSKNEIVKEDWKIAATEFYFSQNQARSEVEKSILKNMPTLILDQLYGTQNRNIPNSEILNRRLDELLKKRLALFLELSKEQKVKDTFILQDLTEYQFDKKNYEQEKKIKNIQKNIDENLEAQEKLIKSFHEEVDEFSSKNLPEENFSFYKNSSNELFKFSENVSKDEFGRPDKKSFSGKKEISDAKINALITGSVIIYSDYAAVTVELSLFPGANLISTITEIGSLKNPEIIAQNIAYKLIPKIENSIPCEIFISVEPAELLEKSKLTIDSTVYNKIPEKLILSNGVHNFIFECEGYKRESFSYGFGYEKKYSIDVTFKKLESIDFALSLKKSIEGNLFYNGKKSLSNEMSVKINNQGVLGFFSTQNENTLFFITPKNQIESGKVVVANFRDYDISELIEKRRRMMYISYSALVCSLPFMFYSYSNYRTLAQSYNEKIHTISIEEIARYQTLSYVGIGVSVACGIWFFVDLILYLNSANKALPVQTKKSNLEFEKSVEDFKNQQTELKEKREAREKIENSRDENSIKENSAVENSTEKNIDENSLQQKSADENEKQNSIQTENENLIENEKINSENLSGEKNG